jgi:cytochrome c oxidase subunit 2
MEQILLRASSYAADIDSVILLVAVLGGFWLILAEAVVFYFLFKYHRSRSPKAQYVTGEKKEEKKWIHIPHNLVLVCDIAIIALGIKVWYHVKQQKPEADSVVRVIGHQWAWEFVHPGIDGKLGTDDDVTTIDELRVVVDKNYHFKLESADVLHSFSVPVFRLKQDAIPGREITGWFKPTKTGTFDLQCTEICGIGHGIMGARIVIESEAEHRQWLEQKAGTQTAAVQPAASEHVVATLTKSGI